MRHPFLARPARLSNYALPPFDTARWQNMGLKAEIMCQKRYNFPRGLWGCFTHFCLNFSQHLVAIVSAWVAARDHPRFHERGHGGRSLGIRRNLRLVRDFL